MRYKPEKRLFTSDNESEEIWDLSVTLTLSSPRRKIWHNNGVRKDDMDGSTLYSFQSIFSQWVLEILRCLGR